MIYDTYKKMPCTFVTSIACDITAGNDLLFGRISLSQKSQKLKCFSQKQADSFTRRRSKVLEVARWKQEDLAAHCESRLNLAGMLSRLEYLGTMSSLHQMVNFILKMTLYMVSFAIFRAFCYILASKVLKIAREIQTWSTVQRDGSENTLTYRIEDVRRLAFN